MSLLPVASDLNPSSSRFTGDYVALGPQNGSSQITLSQIPSPSTYSRIATVSNGFYPKVGKTYQMTLNFILDLTFAGTPAGIVVLAIGYSTADTLADYLVRAQESTVAVNANTSDLVGSLTFSFTHTNSNNAVRIFVQNLTNQNITNASTFTITGLSAVELSSDPATITTIIS